MQIKFDLNKLMSFRYPFFFFFRPYSLFNSNNEDKIDMIFSVANNPRYYESDFFRSSAAKKRYVLQEYPLPTQGNISKYNAFRPITPPNFDQQFQDSRASIYDRPCVRCYDDEQQQHHKSSYKRNTGK